MNINFSRTQQHGKNNIHIQLGNPWSRNELGIGGGANIIENWDKTSCDGMSIEIETSYLYTHTLINKEQLHYSIFVAKMLNIKHILVWQRG